LVGLKSAPFPSRIADTKSLVDFLEKETWRLIFLLENQVESDPILNFLMSEDREESRSELSISKRLATENEELIRLDVCFDLSLELSLSLFLSNW